MTVSLWGPGTFPLLDRLLSHLPPSEAVAAAAYFSPKTRHGGAFFRFQAEWIFEPGRYAVCNKARKIGMTYATTAWAVMRAALMGETVVYVSRKLDVAKEAIRDARRHARCLVALGSVWARHADEPKDEVEFESGGRIVAESADEGGRSFSGNVVLDEAAYFRHADELFDAALPVARLGYSVRVLSTPNGVGNRFHDLYTNPVARKGWEPHEYDYKRAIADGMPLDVAGMWAEAKGDPRVFAQQNECSFLDGVEQYLPTDAIKLATVDTTNVVFGTHYMGVDIGLTNDLTAAAVVTETPDKRIWLRELTTFRRTEWATQEPRLVAIFNNWGCRRMCVDSSSLGIALAQSLQKQLGTARVEPVNFLLQTKEELATGLYQAFTSRSVVDDLPLLRLPRMLPSSMGNADEGHALFLDLCSIKREITVAGNVRYTAEHTDRGHADRAWALSLALHAISFHKTNKAVAERPGGLALDVG